MTSFQLVGMGKNGVQIMTSNDLQNLSPHSHGALKEPVAQPLLYKIDKAALEGFGRLFSGLVMLRTHGTSSPFLNSRRFSLLIPSATSLGRPICRQIP